MNLPTIVSNRNKAIIIEKESNHVIINLRQSLLHQLYLQLQYFHSKQGSCIQSINHVYQNTIVYFHIQASISGTERSVNVASEFNTAASHYDVQYMMKSVINTHARR